MRHRAVIPLKPAGCTGDCFGGSDCTCSHREAPRSPAPRIPRVLTPRRRFKTLRALWAWLIASEP